MRNSASSSTLGKPSSCFYAFLLPIKTDFSDNAFTIENCYAPEKYQAAFKQALIEKQFKEDADFFEKNLLLQMFVQPLGHVETFISTADLDTYKSVNPDDYDEFAKAKEFELDEPNTIDDLVKEFTEKFIDSSQKGKIPAYLEGMISSLKNSKGELPWNLYLKKLMGTVESNRKKTITRRNRRQPNRLDLRGELRGHKAEIAVALDTSGSISDEEFKQAIKEVLNIVKNYIPNAELRGI